MEWKCERNKGDEPDANKKICQEKVYVNITKEGIQMQTFLAIDVYAVWMTEKHSHMTKIPIKTPNEVEKVMNLLHSILDMELANSAYRY